MMAAVVVVCLGGQVADFGEARQVAVGESESELLTMTVTGTPLYMAPEILNGNQYNESVDVFSYSLVSILSTQSSTRSYQRDELKTSQ